MPVSASSAQRFPQNFVTGSVLFYVQHLLGIGHLQRALSLVDAIALEGIAVTLVLGGEPPRWPISARVERLVQLTPVSARDASFKELVGPGGQPIDQKLEKSRREALLAAFDAARPDAVVIEAFPFGRRAFRFELEPLLEAARTRRPRPRILCSLRDIVVVPDQTARRRDIIDRVRADFDFVLVHGDPDFIPLDESFPAAWEIADRLIYTGYVSAPDQPDAKDETAGGRNSRALSAGISSDVAALSCLGESSGIQHDPQHPRRPRPSCGRAVRVREGNRAAAAGGTIGRPRGCRTG